MATAVTLPPGFELDATPAAKLAPQAAAGLPPGFALDALPEGFEVDGPKPQNGDPHLGGEPPEGFYAVTGDDGKQTLRSNIGGGDIMQMLGDLPGVGTAMNMGAGAINLGKKALGGLAGLVTGGNADAVHGVQGEPVQAPPSNDPILHALGAVSGVAEHVAAPVDEAVNELPDGAQTLIHGVEEAIPDVAAVAGARLPLKGVGPSVGDVANVVPKAKAAYRAATGADNDWFKAGLRTGGGHPVARNVAGDSGKEAIQNHNYGVGNTIAASEAGHAKGVPLSYESLTEAREAPSGVYNRVARMLPEGGLDEAARARVEAAGSPEGGRMTKGSPQAQQQVADLKAQLLDPDRSFTGQQMVNELRGLRQEGFANSASDDVSNQQLGKAQLDIARALEDHIGRNLPQGGDVSHAQFQAARKELAKNWTVQAALKGNDVDLKALARVQRNDPELLDGGLKMLAEFANGPGKDVVAIPNRYNPPGTLRDLSGIVNIHRPVQSTIEGIPGVGSSARRFLTGDTDEAIQNAQRMFPGGKPGRHDPLAGLRPPPGRVGELPPVQGSLGDLFQPDSPLPPPGMLMADDPAAAAQAPMGDFAAVLSQGLEHGPAPGLSLGPMGAPQGNGLPFQMSPDMVGAKPVQGGAPKLPARIMDDYGDLVDPAPQPRGNVKLGDRFAGGELSERRSDIAGVRSQGVPEDIAQRTSSKPKVTHEADEDSGEHTVTSKNGSTRGQESGPYLLVKRSDTAKGAQGNGEGLARMEALVQQAENRGLALGSDVSVSPAQQKVYAALKRKGYDVVQNDSSTNPDTGNLVSADPRKPVFEVRSKLAMALEE